MNFSNQLIDEREQELLYLHEKCTRNISEFIKYMSLKNIHQEFYLFCYLLWNGYFSVDKKFVYNNQDIIDENNQVFLGYACCRHNAELLTEVLKKNNINAFSMTIHLEKYKSKLFNIERTIGKSRDNKTSKKQANHLVTIIKTLSNEVFLLDPTNPCECEIIKNWKLIQLTGEYKVGKRLLNDELDYWLFNCSPLKKEKTITSIKLIEDYKIAKEVCEKRQEDFNDFFYDNKENYESIKKLVINK